MVKNMRHDEKICDEPKVVNWLSNFGYIVGCSTLYILALWIIASSIMSMIQEAVSPDFSVYHLLDEVGLIIFSVAVVDVSKFLMIEEVLVGNSKKDSEEIKRTVTKFVLIIATALSLEGLVLTIETAKTNIDKMVYPALLLLLAILFVVGLGIYQKLISKTEK